MLFTHRLSRAPLAFTWLTPETSLQLQSWHRRIDWKHNALNKIKPVMCVKWERRKNLPEQHVLMWNDIFSPLIFTHIHTHRHHLLPAQVSLTFLWIISEPCLQVLQQVYRGAFKPRWCKLHTHKHRFNSEMHTFQWGGDGSLQTQHPVPELSLAQQSRWPQWWKQRPSAREVSSKQMANTSTVLTPCLWLRPLNRQRKDEMI